MRLSSINNPIWWDLRWLRWRTANNEIEFLLTHSNCDCQQKDAFRIELDHFSPKNLTRTPNGINENNECLMRYTFELKSILVNKRKNVRLKCSTRSFAPTDSTNWRDELNVLPKYFVERWTRWIRSIQCMCGMRTRSNNYFGAEAAHTNISTKYSMRWVARR